MKNPTFQIVGAVSLLQAFFANPAAAQEVRIDQLHPASPSSIFIRAEGPRSPVEDGIEFSGRLATEYVNSPLSVRFAESEFPLVEHALLMHLGVGFRPADWLDFNANWTVAPFEAGTEGVELDGRSYQQGMSGVGDVRLGGVAYLSTAQDLAFGLGGAVWLPVGTDSSYLSGRQRFARFEATAVVAGSSHMWAYGCTARIAPLFFAGRSGDRLATSCAAQIKVSPLISAGLEPHFALFSSSPNTEETPGLGAARVEVQFEPLATVAARLGPVMVSAFGGPGFGSAPGTAAGRVGLSVGFKLDTGVAEVTPDAPDDSDGDGIIDDDDQCPNEAGTEERHGCAPETDDDNDGVVADDACPDAAGPASDDPKTTGCPDTDNDGLPDPIDACVNEPGEADVKGCPLYARLKANRFEIRGGAHFGRFNAKLVGTSSAALIEVIETVRATPEIEKLRLALGTKRTPKHITKRRVDALTKLLDHRNLPRDRFEIILSHDVVSGHVEARIVR